MQMYQPLLDRANTILLSLSYKSSYLVYETYIQL